MTRQKLLILTFLLGIFLPLSYASAGTVLSAYKYAWSNNVGYINFENVTVDDHLLTGYAWSTNAGWIKFNPAKGGVFNDGMGNLSGYAWGEQLGWINFGNVKISTSNGKFSGDATGTLAGIINFDCVHCDVRADWPISSTSTVAGSVPTWSTPTPETPTTPTEPTTPTTPLLPHIDGHNEILNILPNQDSTLTQDVPSLSPVTIEMPGMGSDLGLILSVTVEPIATLDKLVIPENVDIVGGYVYDILLKYTNGVLVHSLPKPITITLPIPKEFIGSKKLAVYWLNETNQQWVLIPEAVFHGDKTTFQVSHLTRFSVIRPLLGGVKVEKYPAQSYPISVEKKATKVAPVVQQKTVVEKTKTVIDWTLVIAVIILIILYILFRNKIWKREFFKPVV